MSARGTGALCRALIGVLGCTTLGFARAPATCEGPGTAAWFTAQRDRVLQYDRFAEWAVEKYGAPIACDGAVTAEFDGALYGTITLSFAGDVQVEIETMPPETSIATLRSVAGFEDEAEVRALLERHAAATGLDIDWTRPEIERDGPEERHRFSDPDPGLNASAVLVFVDGRLVAVTLSMAL